MTNKPPNTVYQFSQIGNFSLKTIQRCPKTFNNNNCLLNGKNPQPSMNKKEANILNNNNKSSKKFSKNREVCKFAGDSNLYFQNGKFLVNSFKKKDIKNVESFFKKKYDVAKSKEKSNRRSDKSKLKLQSTEEVFERYCFDHLKKLNISEKVGDFIENLCIMIRMMLTAKNFSDVQLAIMVFVKLHSGMSFLEQYGFLIKKLLDTLNLSVQSSTPFDGLKNIFSKYNELKNTQIFDKFYKIITYVISFTIFKDFAVSRNWEWLHQMHYKAKSVCTTSSDLFMTVLESLVFIMEQGYTAIKTGSWEPLLKTSDYEEWFSMADKLKTDAVYLNNPEAFGMDIFKFLSDMSHCIEQGAAIQKHLVAVKSYEARFVGSVLSNLRLIESEYLTKRASMKSRKCPFSLLIYGGSSVAKSTFTQLTFIYYAKLYNLDCADEFKYVRNFADEYWVNFSTMQWCIHLDDVAFIKPGVSAGVDPSLMEIIGVVNNVAYVPVQADLADKGRTPVRSKLVLATTNTDHLNAHANFSCPLAIQRRFPYVVTLKPKKEYAINHVMIDGAKLPPLREGEFPNYWIISISKVEPIDDQIPQRAQITPYLEFTEINDYLLWFKEMNEKHDAIQNKVEICNDSLYDIKLCRCGLSTQQCRCVEIQSKFEFIDNLSNKIETFAVSSYNYSIDRTDIYLRQCRKEVAKLVSIYSVEDWIVYSIKFLIAYMYFRMYTIVPLIRRLPGSQLALKFSWDIMGSSVSFQKGMAITLYKTGRAFVKLPSTIGALLLGVIVIRSLYSISNKFLFGFQNVNEFQSKEGNSPLPDVEEREPVWYKQDVPISAFDVSPQIISYKGLDEKMVVNLIKNNSFFIRCFVKHDTSKPGRMFCVGSQIYLANSHVIPDMDNFKMNIIKGPQRDGVSINRCVTISRNDVYRIPNTDICFMRIRYMSPCKDLSQLFTSLDFTGKYNAQYVIRDENGEIDVRQIQNFCVRNVDNFKTWYGLVDRPTINGHCGSVCVVNTGYGPAIFGIHILGGVDHIIGIQTVSRDQINDAISHFGKYVMSSKPRISSSSAINELGELQPHASIRYVQQGHAECYGSFLGFRPKFKSQVRLTSIARECMNNGYILQHAAPRGKWLPWRRAFEETSNIVEHIDTNILDNCVSTFTNDIKKCLKKEDIEELIVYDDMTAVNGCNGVTYVDKINRATSAGFPWCKSKKYFLEKVPPCENVDDPRMPNKEIMDNVDEIIENYKLGYRSGTVFMGSQKDEALTFQKVKDEKDRIFTGSAFDFSIVMRKYFLSVTRCVQKNRFAFECAAGTIAQSLEWEQIYESMTVFGTDRMVAGDYSKFDKRMSAVFIEAAFQVLINIISLNSTITEVDTKVMWGIAYDIMFPYMNLKGDLYEFHGGNPSGQPLTVIINSIVNCLYIRYAYSLLSPLGNAIRFKEHVRMMTYGDDNFMNISRECNFFNHTTIVGALAKIGVVYTMADKEAQSVPFITMENVSFLKRQWRWNDEIGAIIAPLEDKSISKMLLIGVHSKSGPSDENHAIEVIESALREYFYYGRQRYDDRRALLMKIVEQCNLQNYVTPNTFRSFDSYIADFWRASKHVVLSRQCPQRAKYVCPAAANQNIPFSLVTADEVTLSSVVVQSESGKEKYPEGAFPPKLSIQSGKTDKKMTFQKIDRASDSNLISITKGKASYKSGHVRTMRKRRKLNSDPFRDLRNLNSNQNQQCYICGATAPESGCITQCDYGQFPILDNDELDYSDSELYIWNSDESVFQKVGMQTETKDGTYVTLTMQSEIESHGNLRGSTVYKSGPSTTSSSSGGGGGSLNPELEGTEKEREENVLFADENSGESTGMIGIHDAISKLDALPSISLQRFFSRPVKIQTLTWNESDGVGTQYASVFPWANFFGEAVIQNKLDNYAFVKCDLKIKAVVNASPFYYGALMMAYHPLYNFHKDTVTKSVGNQYLVPLSQRPHAWVYPQRNEGFEMTLPYFNTTNFIDTTLRLNFQNMGVVNWFVYAPLTSANGVTGSGVTITLYAWAENVELTGPSIGLTVQSQDEYGKNPISNPASAIANAAKALTSIPLISSYATATEMGARAVANVARSLGYSNPPVIDPVKAYKPTAFPSLATSEISYPVEKLTLDPKNELTIDPSVAGMSPHDELSIPYLVQKESYLTQATWSTTNVQDDILFQSYVSPILWSEDDQRAAAAKQAYIYLTPMAWVGYLFNSWRGDIIFSIRVIASQYHKGRLRISYDPNGTVGQNIGLISDTTTAVLTQIIDLSKDTAVEFRIPYQQPAPWCNYSNYKYPDSMPLPWITNSNLGFFAHIPNVSNGMFNVRVLNALSAPVATSSVTLLISVRGAENLEFANPGFDAINNGTFSYLKVQSGFEYDHKCDELNLADQPATTPSPQRYLLNYGESIPTLRQLMRRYNEGQVLVAIPSDTTSDYSFIRYVLYRTPGQPGYDLNSPYLEAKSQLFPTVTIPYNWINFGYITWIIPAFMGMRGSINWIFNVNNQNNPVQELKVYRNSDVFINQNSTTYRGAVATTSSPGFLRAYQYFSRKPGTGGLSLTSQQTQAGLQVSVPNMNHTRFETTSVDAMVGNSSALFPLDVGGYETFSLEVALNDTILDRKNCKITTYNAIGTDFNVHFFLNVPTLFIYAAAPISV